MSDSEKQTDESAESEEQKRLDLGRAQRHDLKRPGKKEKRFSEIDGRYIPPPELQKEIDKLAEAKAQALQARQKKGLRGLFVRTDTAQTAEEREEKKRELKAAGRQIKELRGMKSRSEIRKEKKSKRKESLDDEALTAETEAEALPERREPQAKRKSFSDTVKLLNAESAKPDAYKPLRASPAQKKLPDGVLVDGLFFPVGVIYYDAHDLPADRVIVVKRVLRRSGELLLDAHAPDTDRDGFIPMSRVCKLYDLRTMTEIQNPYAFVSDGIRNARGIEDETLIDILARARYDLVLLGAVAGNLEPSDGTRQSVVCDYISARCGFIAFDGGKLLDYIKSLGSDDAAFQDALDVLVCLPRDVVSNLVRAFLQLVLGGGIVRPKQRELTAELFYALRIAGIELNIMGL